jgi:hypothetical protein
VDISPVLSKLGIAWLVMAFCVVVHAAGLTLALRWLRRHRILTPRFRAWTWLFVRLAGWIVLLHLIEIGGWAALYAITGTMADLQSAAYFSAVTYTTTGYGDLLLPRPWQLVGAIEALTGILMCGWSSGFFFAAVSRLLQEKDERGALT